MRHYLKEVQRFTGFLSNRPNIQELVKRLGQDFFAEFDLNYIRIFQVGPKNILTEILTEPQEINSDVLEIGSAEGLKSKDHSSNLIKDLINNRQIINDSKTCLLGQVSNGQVLVGIIEISFSQPLNTESMDRLGIFTELLSFYLFPKLSADIANNSLAKLSINPLSARQRLVLHGFIEGKTNHELSVELGFSISTIRHETMAIYKLLGVSDRKEAARIAQESSLI